MSGHCFIASENELFVFDGFKEQSVNDTFIHNFQDAKWISVSLKALHILQSEFNNAICMLRYILLFLANLQDLEFNANHTKISI